MRASDVGGTRWGPGPTSRTPARYTVNARGMDKTPRRLKRARRVRRGARGACVRVLVLCRTNQALPIHSFAVSRKPVEWREPENIGLTREPVGSNFETRWNPRGDDAARPNEATAGGKAGGPSGSITGKRFVSGDGRSPAKIKSFAGSGKGRKSGFGGFRLTKDVGSLSFKCRWAIKHFFYRPIVVASRPPLA